MRSVWLLALGLLLAGCINGGDPAPSPEDQQPRSDEADDGSTEAFAMKVTSSAFEENETIPAKYTADGEDISPPLSINEPPEGTVSFALIVDDPDAPRDEPWVHWLLWGIPADAETIPEGYPPSGDARGFTGAGQGTNDFGNVEYGGPAPPEGHGVHHYRFTLYALDTDLDLDRGANRTQMDAAMDGHVLAQDRYTGTYER